MNRVTDGLQQEQVLGKYVNALILACTLTGFTTYLVSQFSVWQQWSVLFHVLLGLLLSLLLLPYSVMHFRRTLGFRRAGMLASGILLFALLVACVISGWSLFYHGQSENRSWVLTLHIAANLGFLGVLLLHLLLHVQFMPAHRKNSPLGRFPSIAQGALRFGVMANLGVQAGIVVATIGYVSVSVAPPAEAVQPYASDYGAHPFRPSQTETADGGFVHVAQIANSEQCINCHQAIGAQWLASVHQQAAADPTYVTNINLLEQNKGITATRYCEGCHAPVALLTGQLTPGGKHGGVPGTAANREGVSCMSCHGIHRMPHIKGVASYEFSPASDYLFAHSDNPLLVRIHEHLIRMKPQQHKRDVGGDILKDSKVCASCHTQFMDKDMNDWGWVKMQDEYAAWLSSPHSGHNEENFAAQSVNRCQDCHMPLVSAEDPSADENGMVRSHHFPGANTFLPLLRGDKQQFEAVKRFLQNNKMRVSIDKPSRQDAVQSQDYIDEAIRDVNETEPFYYLGEKVQIQIVVSNIGVGHDFPGGTVDINEAWLEFAVKDGEGREIYTSGMLQEDGQVEPQAHFYRALAVDRRGNLVWRHDLFNMVGETFRRVVPSGGADIASYEFQVPAWAKSPMTVVATLKYRKLNQRYAQWALKDKYFDLPVIDMAWDSVIIPLKIRKEVATSAP